MNVYIDLGAHKGLLLKKVVRYSHDADLFVAFEPVEELYHKVAKKFKNDHRVKILNCAAGCEDRNDDKFYIHRKHKRIRQGSTLIEGIYDSFCIINTVNFSKYLEENFKLSDKIVLKIDIEGYEYDLLEHLIETGNIKYINKIYCEWHVKKLIKTLGNAEKIVERHNDLIFKLQKLGFNLKGKNKYDELSVVIRKMIRAKTVASLFGEDDNGC